MRIFSIVAALIAVMKGIRKLSEVTIVADAIQQSSTDAVLEAVALRTSGVIAHRINRKIPAIYIGIE